MASTESLLRIYKLRNTAIRREVLELFLQAGHALSHGKIEQDLRDQFDRVTLYRTLKTFEDNGILHRVVNDRDTIEYALCKHEHEEEHDHQHKHLDNHVHFECQSCKNTFCLEQTPVPDIDIPVDYKVSNIQILLIGICDKCKQKTGR